MKCLHCCNAEMQLIEQVAKNVVDDYEIWHCPRCGLLKCPGKEFVQWRMPDLVRELAELFRENYDPRTRTWTITDLDIARNRALESVLLKSRNELMLKTRST